MLASARVVIVVIAVAACRSVHKPERALCVASSNPVAQILRAKYGDRARGDVLTDPGSCRRAAEAIGAVDAGGHAEPVVVLPLRGGGYAVVAGAQGMPSPREVDCVAELDASFRYLGRACE